MKFPSKSNNMRRWMVLRAIKPALTPSHALFCIENRNKCPLLQFTPDDPIDLTTFLANLWWEPISDSKIHGANMGPTWGHQDPGGPHVGHTNLAIWDVSMLHTLWPLTQTKCTSLQRKVRHDVCLIFNEGVEHVTTSVFWYMCQCTETERSSG